MTLSFRGLVLGMGRATFLRALHQVGVGLMLNAVSHAMAPGLSDYMDQVILEGTL